MVPHLFYISEEQVGVDSQINIYLFGYRGGFYGWMEVFTMVGVALGGNGWLLSVSGCDGLFQKGGEIFEKQISKQFGSFSRVGKT